MKELTNFLYANQFNRLTNQIYPQMKKAVLTMFTMVSLGASYGIAQSNTLLASNNVDHSIYITDNNSTESNEIDASDANTPKMYDIPEHAATFQMGATSGQLNIDVNSNIKYTKAELLSKDNNTTIQTLEMNESNKSVDISKVKSGTYYMILSNEAGDVFSEKIIII